MHVTHHLQRAYPHERWYSKLTQRHTLNDRELFILLVNIMSCDVLAVRESGRRPRRHLRRARDSRLVRGLDTAVFGFYLACRWALSLFALQLATPATKRVKCKSTARARLGEARSPSRRAACCLPASPARASAAGPLACTYLRLASTSRGLPVSVSSLPGHRSLVVWQDKRRAQAAAAREQRTLGVGSNRLGD